MLKGLVLNAYAPVNVSRKEGKRGGGLEGGLVEQLNQLRFSSQMSHYKAFVDDQKIKNVTKLKQLIESLLNWSRVPITDRQPPP